MKKYIDHYDEHYRRSGLRGAGEGFWEHKLDKWKKSGYVDGMSVLDYGCGWGSSIPAVSNKKAYLGVDISAEAIKLAKEQNPGMTFSVFYPGKLDVGQFDFVCAHSVFTHTPKDSVVPCLLDIKRAMKETAIIDVLHGKDNPRDLHIRYMTVEEWHQYLKEAGLKGEFIEEYVTTAQFKHSFYKITKDE